MCFWASNVVRALDVDAEVKNEDSKKGAIPSLFSPVIATFIAYDDKCQSMMHSLETFCWRAPKIEPVEDQNEPKEAGRKPKQKNRSKSRKRLVSLLVIEEEIEK